VGSAPEAVPVEVPWLHIDADAHQEAILRSVKLRMFSPRSREWERFYEQAAAFYTDHGHLDVTDGELRVWLTRQRSLRTGGFLDPARVSELDAIGMIWSKHAAAWDRGLAYAKAWHTRHGHLMIPATARLDGYSIGAWNRRQRQGYADLTDDQRTELDALDPLWPSGSAPTAASPRTSPPAAPSPGPGTAPAPTRTPRSGPAYGSTSRAPSTTGSTATRSPSWTPSVPGALPDDPAHAGDATCAGRVTGADDSLSGVPGRLERGRDRRRCQDAQEARLLTEDDLAETLDRWHDQVIQGILSRLRGVPPPPAPHDRLEESKEWRSWRSSSAPCRGSPRQDPSYSRLRRTTVPPSPGSVPCSTG
jgi:hypothetical protein